MNYEEIQDFFEKNVRYKKDWAFTIGKKGETIYLQIQFLAEDNYNPGKKERQHCRKWQLSEWMTETELVQTAWAAVQRAELHEASELFKFRGADIYNTHMSVNELHRLRKHPAALEHRAPAAVS